MTRTIDAAEVIARIAATVEVAFVGAKFDWRNDDGIHKGGWINVEARIYRAGDDELSREIATAEFGCNIYTRYSNFEGVGADLRYQTSAEGIATETYGLADRRVTWRAPDASALLGIPDADLDAVDDLDVVLMSLAMARCESEWDAETIYRAALIAWLADSEHVTTDNLIRAAEAMST